MSTTLETSRVDVKLASAEVHVHQGPVDVPKMQRKTVDVCIVGTSPLITHQHVHNPSKDPLKKPTPEQRWKNKCFMISGQAGEPGAVYGMLIYGLKYAIMRSAEELQHLTMTLLGGSLLITDDDGKPTEMGQLLRLYGDPPVGTRFETRKDEDSPVKESWSPVFARWGCKFKVQYLEDVLTKEQVLQLITAAGEKVGIGDRRKGRGGDGSYGSFRIVDEKTFAKLLK